MLAKLSLLVAWYFSEPHSMTLPYFKYPCCVQLLAVMLFGAAPHVVRACQALPNL